MNTSRFTSTHRLRWCTRSWPTSRAHPSSVPKSCAVPGWTVPPAPPSGRGSRRPTRWRGVGRGRTARWSSRRSPGGSSPFRVPKRFAGTLVWRYLFQPDGDGALVTESYEVTRPVSRLGWFIIGRLYGRHDRRADLRAGMEHTLHRIRESAESGAHLVANGDVRRGEHVAVPRVDFAGVLDVHVVAAPGCARRPILVATIAFGFDVATHSHDDTR